MCLEMFHTANPLKEANSHSGIQIRFRPRVRVSVELVKGNKAVGFSLWEIFKKKTFIFAIQAQTTTEMWIQIASVMQPNWLFWHHNGCGSM